MTRIDRRTFASAAIGGALAAMARRAVAQPAPALRTGTPADAVYALAREAYTYAYPLVTMDTTMRQATNVPDARSVNMRAPLNQFAHARAYPRAEARDIVRFNFDTLYSFAWLDLTAGPMVVTAPDTAGRYFLLPMLDMWSDVFMTVGTRTVGNGGGHWAVVPPGWTGRLPEGVGRIDAPTPVVWILGRTQTNGAVDYANVHRVQDGYQLTPLAQWGHGDQPPPAGRVDPAVDDRTPPMVQVDRLDGIAMLSRLAEFSGRHPPHLADQPILARLRRGLGLVPGRPFNPDGFDSAAREAINHAAADALADFQPAFERTVRVVNGWLLQNDNIGTYGTSYLKRAIIAKGGLGANLPEDAVYPTAILDAEGRPLTGENRYVLRFERGQLPPADAFWSLTMYDMDGFQVPNPLSRFALGDRDSLAFGPDGSLEILVRAESPGEGRDANWLPAPRARFQPNLRLYSPRAEVLDGRWAPPAFQRVG